MKMRLVSNVLKSKIAFQLLCTRFDLKIMCLYPNSTGCPTKTQIQSKYLFTMELRPFKNRSVHSFFGVNLFTTLGS